MLELGGVDERGLEVQDKDGTRRRIDAVTKVWAAGVQASELGAMLAEQSGAEIDRAGRVKVNDDLTLPGHPEVFVVGDMATLKGYPGVAQVAIQGARYAANADRGLPHCLVDAQSAAQLRDRIKSMRLANIYEPHSYRHVIGPIRVLEGADRDDDADPDAEGAAAGRTEQTSALASMILTFGSCEMATRSLTTSPVTSASTPSSGPKIRGTTSARRSAGTTAVLAGA